MGIKLPRKINKNDERATMGFEIPNGKYLTKVIGCEQRTPKNGGDDYLAVELEILDAAREKGENCIGFKLFEQLALTEKAQWRLTGFLDACYPPRFDGDEIPTDIDNGDIMITVDAKMEEYEGFNRPRCQSFKPATEWNGVTMKVDGAKNVTYKDESGKVESGKAAEKSTKQPAAKADGKEEVVM